jgi:hypothetical protein
MGIVAIGTITHRTRVLNLGLFDLLGLLGVTGNAKRLGIGLRQYDLAVFGRRVAGVALPAGKGCVRELRHQFWLSGLMRIVAGEAVSLINWLILVRLGDGRILRIVAIDAQRRRIFGQMEVELTLAALARLVRNVARVATHIERSVPAAALGHIHAGVVAAQTQVCVLSIATDRLEQLIFVIRRVRVVTLDAVSNRRAVNFALYVGGFLVCVAGEAQAVSCSSDQLYAGNIFINADFMTTRTTRCNGRMNYLAF